jgi:hypothetical protein
MSCRTTVSATTATLFALASLHLCQLSAAVVIPSDPAKFHIFVIMGQSNAAGLGGVIEAADTIVNPVIHKYWPLRKTDGSWLDFGSTGNRAYAGEWVPGTEPIGPNQWSPKPKPGETGVCALRSFAIQLTAHDPTITIGLLNVAVSGSALQPWTKGGQYYSDNITIINAAKQLGTLKAILWHQGEAGTGCSGCLYDTMWAGMIRDMRADLAMPNLPFLACKIGTSGDSWGVNASLEAAVSRTANTAVVSSADFTLYDNVHYDANSQRLMGLRFAQAYLKLTGDNATLPLTIASTRYGTPRTIPFQRLLQADNGGASAITWSLVGSSLPAGMTLAGDTIHGTASAQPGVYPFTVQASRNSVNVTKALTIDISVPVAFAKQRDTVYAPPGRTTDYLLQVSNSGYEPMMYRYFSFPSLLKWQGPWSADSNTMHFTPTNTDTSMSLSIAAGAGQYNDNWDTLPLRVVIGDKPVGVTAPDHATMTATPAVSRAAVRVYSLTGKFLGDGWMRQRAGACVVVSSSLSSGSAARHRVIRFR